jgi:hypothetical protein
LASNGARLTIFTEEAIKELEEVLLKKKVTKTKPISNKTSKENKSSLSEKSDIDKEKIKEKK